MSESLLEPVVSFVRQQWQRARSAWMSVIIVAFALTAIGVWVAWQMLDAHYRERITAQQAQIALRDDAARLQTRPPVAQAPSIGPGTRREATPPPVAPERTAAPAEPATPARREPVRPERKKDAEPQPGSAPPATSTPRVEVPAGGISAPNGVVSVNQQGGITTGSLNVNMPNPASLTVRQGEIMHAVLASVTAKPTEVSLGHHISDGASSNVARQLATVLTQVGWKFSLAVLPVSADGVLIEAEQGLAAAQALQDALRKAGVKATFQPKGGLPSGYISVIIGPS